VGCVASDAKGCSAGWAYIDRVVEKGYVEVKSEQRVKILAMSRETRLPSDLSGEGKSRERRSSCDGERDALRGLSQNVCTTAAEEEEDQAIKTLLMLINQSTRRSERKAKAKRRLDNVFPWYHIGGTAHSLAVGLTRDD